MTTTTEILSREGGDIMAPTHSPTASTHESHAQHTPGPWQVERIAFANHFEYRVIREQEMDVIANVAMTDSGDEELPNARLIAAAPDLLAALRLCRSALNEEIIAAGDLDHPTIRAHAKAAECADAAIANAEGEERR